MEKLLSGIARAPRQLIGIVIFTLVSLLLTSLIIGTLMERVGGEKKHYYGLFRDVSGVRVGDDVRVAGIKIGEVTSLKLVGNQAKVGFDVHTDTVVSQDTIIAVNYLNLLGQRYLQVKLPPGVAPSQPLPEDTVIPVSRTEPALDLTKLFNAFQPLFELLRPEDVNLLAKNIVQVLQGEGPNLRSLMAQTAKITSAISARDNVIGRVIDNLTLVMNSISANRGQIRSLVFQLNRLISTIGSNKQVIAATMDRVQRAITLGADLISATSANFTRDVKSLGDFGKSFSSQGEAIGPGLGNMQYLLEGYAKTLGLGSYLNVYVCTLRMRIASVPGQVKIGSGLHSERCR